MRKFYSYVLMVTALLIGTNAWAELHDAPQQASDEAKVQIKGGAWQYASTLKEAFDAVDTGAVATIELLKSISLNDEAITMPKELPTNAQGNGILPQTTGQNITLDLGNSNFSITTTAQDITPFRLVKGSLNIKGKGTIVKTAANDASSKYLMGSAVIAVCGTEFKDKKDWSVLTIGKDVIITVSDSKGRGVAITNHDGVGSLPDGDVLKCKATISDIRKKYGYDTRVEKSNAFSQALTDNFSEQVAQKIAEDHTSASTYEQRTLPMDCGQITSNKKNILQGAAYGVKLYINGTIIAPEYAIHVHGNINQKPDCAGGTRDKSLPAPYYGEGYQYPYVNIGSTAHIRASETAGNVALYAAGWAVWDISGEVQGATGIYAKAGDVVLKDAVVASNCNTFGKNGKPGDFLSSGVNDAGGTAIVIESSDTYAGGTGLTVTGDTKVTGNGGCAIFDQTTKTDESDPTTTHVTIEGGTREAGAYGAITITEGTVAVTSIAGGNLNSNTVTVDKGNDVTETVTVNNFLVAGTHTTVVKDGNKDIVVVSKGGEPDTKTTLDAIIAAYTAWVNGGKQGEAPSVKATGTLGDLEQNLELKELEINETTSQTLTIKAGNTLTVGRVILGANAQIIVEPGAKFIVTGSDGIVAPKVSNIVLMTSPTAQAIFLFNPEVSSNKHPNATVKMLAKGIGRNENNDYYWHRFTTPLNNKITSWEKEGSLSGTTYPTYLYRWDYENEDWANSTVADMKPMTGYSLTLASEYIPGAATDGYLNVKQNVTYIFKGELVGNVNEPVSFQSEGFNFFGNSYTANMSVKNFIAGIADSHIDGTVYLWCNDEDVPEYQSYVGVSAYHINQGHGEAWQQEISPMQTFILKLRGADEASETVNYANAVWGNPSYSSFTAAQAPRRKVESTVVENAYMQICVKAANGKGDKVDFAETNNNSDAFESGYDVAKYMNTNTVNLYSTIDGEDYSSVVTNQIEGKTLSLKTNSEFVYTLTFKNVEGNEYALLDKANNQVVAIEEGASYEFNAQPNSTVEGRFEIIDRYNMPTAIDNTEAAKNVKGVYTITGQYVGEDINVLPAGVYVVNGVKIVK